jgi:membrane protein
MTFSTLRDLLVTTGRETMDDDVPSLAAAIAYYTIFALPPLLVVIVAIAGAVFGPDAVMRALLGQVGSLVGDDGTAAIEAMIAEAGDLGSGIGSKIAGLAALLIGATGAFGQLQKALNRAWEVEPGPESGIKDTILKRLLSLGMIVTIAFLLLASLAVSAVLSAVGDAAAGVAGDGVLAPVMWVVNLVVSLGVITALFAAMFKVLPDVRLAWRDVAVGAFATALLFTLGKFLIGLYLGRSDPGSAFGAAGSVVLILVWIYYSALIVLVGAEFTQAWALKKGAGMEPAEGFVRSPGSLAERSEQGGDDAPEGTSAAAEPVEPTDVPSDAGGFSIEDASSGRTRR